MSTSYAGSANYSETGSSYGNDSYTNIRSIAGESNVLFKTKDELGTPRKGQPPMSLIVTIQNKNGIVFCSDSKSTYRDSMVTPYTEEDRQVKKLWHAGTFLLATCGRNKVLRDGDLENIEDMISDVLNSGRIHSPDDFLRGIKGSLNESFQADNTSPFEFVIGRKLTYTYEVDHILMSPIESRITPSYGDGIRYFGMMDCVPRNIIPNGNWTLEEMESAARLLVKSAMVIGDTFLIYNPVGGPIQSISIQ